MTSLTMISVGLKAREGDAGREPMRPRVLLPERRHPRGALVTFRQAPNGRRLDVVPRMADGQRFDASRVAPSSQDAW